MAEAQPRTCYRHPDRETGLSCSECGRPICYECMTPAAVGLRCPDHSGQAQGIQRVRRSAQRAAYESAGAIVTKTLIALNVAIYLAELANGGSTNGVGSRIYFRGALDAPDVAHGDWWRLLTAAFLHYGPIHLGMNMLALWWFGQPLEHALGRARFLMLYLVSGIAGSALALVITPLAYTVGASGAIFGILGAALILERHGSMVFGGQALTLIVINLVFTFAVPGISWGGHVGGLIGGAVCMLALLHFRRQPVLQVAAMLGVAAAAVAISYFKVRGYA